MIKFSQEVKEQFFAYMDIQKLGMIDYKNFLTTLNKTVYNKYSKSMNQGDNWSWEDEALERIRQWFRKQGLSVEDAFRAADKDFDGFINK